MKNGLIPSSYLLEVSGRSIKTIIPDNFGITKININSGLFSNDLDARAALIKAMKHLSPNKTHAVESFNPEFFPSLDPIEVLNDEDDIKLTIEELQNTDDGKIFVPISKKFDSVGDFVICRQVKKSSTYGLIGRVLASPAWYAADLIEQTMNQSISEKVVLN